MWVFLDDIIEELEEKKKAHGIIIVKGFKSLHPVHLFLL